MDCYLVLLRHSMDDLPVQIFPHTKKGREEACFFAGKLKPTPTKKIRTVFETDCSTPVCAWVIEYKKGKPIAVIGGINYK